MLIILCSRGWSQSQILLWVQESFPCVSGRLPMGAGCHGSSGKAGRTHWKGVREEEGPLVLFFQRFSSLWPGLARQALQKLQKIGISGKMYNYIKTFLSRCSMQVWWKGAMSAVKTVSMGVPQGSVIAPLLFNIMVHDVVTAVTGKVVITMYADDLAIWLDTHIRTTMRGTLLAPSTSSKPSASSPGLTPQRSPSVWCGAWCTCDWPTAWRPCRTSPTWAWPVSPGLRYMDCG